MERAFQSLQGKKTPLLRFAHYGKYTAVYGFHSVTYDQLSSIEKAFPDVCTVVLFSPDVPARILAVVVHDADAAFNPQDDELRKIKGWRFTPLPPPASYEWQRTLAESPVLEEQRTPVSNLQAVLDPTATIVNLDLNGETITIHANALFFQTASFQFLATIQTMRFRSCTLGSRFHLYRPTSLAVTAARQQNLLAPPAKTDDTPVTRVASQTRGPRLRCTVSRSLLSPSFVRTPSLLPPPLE
jgi:hypothetical protein